MEMNFEGRAKKKKKRQDKKATIELEVFVLKKTQIITNSLLMCILASSAAFEVCFSKSKGKWKLI